MLSAIDVAHYVIARTNKIGHGISNLKLQKVLYLIQAEFLVVFDHPCFVDDIEARSFGVVVPSVYNKFKMYGACRIWYLEDRHPEWLQLDVAPDEKYHINCVIDDLLDIHSSDLTQITINQDPWKKTYQKDQRRIIKPSLIKEYFQEE